MNCVQKSYIRWFWPIFGTNDSLKSPLHYQQGTLLKGSYTSKILHKIVTTRKWIHFYSFWCENDQKVPKMSYLMQFWPIFGPYDRLKSPLHYQRSTVKGSFFPKVSINYYYRKMDQFPPFWSENDRKVPKVSYLMQFWPILE